MSTNYIAPIWRMPENANNTPVDKLSNYSIDTEGTTGIDCGLMSDLFGTTSIDFNTSYSIWIKPEFAYNTSTYQTFFGNLASGNFGVLLYYHTGEDKWFFLAGNGSTNQKIKSAQITSDEELGRGEWQHHCVVYDYENSSAYYYINNSLVSTTSSLSITINNTGKNWHIGKKWDLSSGTFTGKVAQACVFDYALSTDQRNYLYNLNDPMDITGGEPIAYWPLGDNSNPNANAGYPNISTGTDSVFDFTPNQYMDIGDSNLFSFGDSVNDFPFSISGWFYFDTTGSYGLVAKYGTTSTSREWMLYTTGSNFRLLLYDTNGNNAYADASDTTIVANKWYHVVATYNGAGGVPDARDGIQIYVNGQAETMTRAGGAGYVAMHNTERELELGTRSNTSYFDGQMSNVQIWDAELSAPNALELYNDGQPLMTGTQPQQSNLLAWWKLNQSAIWDNTDWSIDNAKSPANWQGCYDRNNSPVAMLRDNNSGPSYHNQVFSISVWVKPVSGLATGGVIFSNQNSSNQGVSLAYNNNALVFKLGDKDTTAVGGASGNWANNNNRVPGASPTYTPYDSWSHIVVVWNGTNSKFYINGDLVSTITPPSALTIDYSFPSDQISAIGGRNDSTASGGIFTGKISNFAYWSSEIDQTAVTALYNNGTPEVSISQSPDHWFTLEDFDNGRVDQVGSLNYNDTATTAVPKFTRNFVSRTSATSEGMNTTNLVQSNLTRTQPYSNYSIQFDAAGGDYARTTAGSNSILSGSTSFTISAWVNFADTASLRPIVTNWEAGTASYNYIFRYQSGQLQLYVRANGASGSALYSWTPTLDTWYNVIGTWDGSTGAIKLYINGVDTGATGSITGTMPNITVSDNIGLYTASGTNYYMDGKLSNIAYWKNSALSEDDILNIYNNGITQDLNNFRITPINWFPLNESYTYFNGTSLILRDAIASRDATGFNIVQENIVGNAPGSQASGTGTNLTIADLKGDMYNSDKNAFSINMGDYADGVTNPANSGRSTDTP